MGAHTPGEWWASPPSGVVGVAIMRQGHFTDGPIATVVSGNTADASLIRAAPELLAALRELVRACDGAHGIELPERVTVAMDEADKIIAKADGG